MPVFSTHTRGFLMTFSGVLILTPDTLLIRLIDTDVGTMVFWRGVLMAIGIKLLLFLVYRQDTLQIVKQIGSRGLVIVLLSALNAITFTAAVIYTTVAKTLIILATAPLFASLFSLLLLKERLLLSTWVVIASCCIGMFIVVSDHLGQASGSILGDASALASAILMALTLTLIRLGKEVNMLPAMGLGWVVSALLVLPLASPFSLTGTQIPLMALLGLVVLPVSFALIGLGPRYIPSAEVSLLLLLETILGPLWVWLVVHEQPNGSTLVGGTMIVVSIMIYWSWRLYSGSGR